MILVHGLGASGRFWRLVVEALAGEARIFCPDLLGFGRSPWPPVAYTVADHIAALDRCLDNLALDGEQVVLAGHSTGAVLALAWAAARRERFSGLGLVLLAPRPSMPCQVALTSWGRITTFGTPDCQPGSVGHDFNPGSSKDISTATEFIERNECAYDPENQCGTGQHGELKYPTASPGAPTVVSSPGPTLLR